MIVFDGGKLKIKSKIEKGRNKNREDNKLKAKQSAAEGDQQNAMRLFAMSIDITPQMAHTLILCL